MSGIGKKAVSLALTLIMLLGFMVYPPKVFAFTASNASTAMSNLIQTYWDADTQYFYRNSDHQIHGTAATDGDFSYQPEGGLYTDFWWEAQLWETVMDAYQRNGSATYRTMIDSVYAGWLKMYPNWRDNQFNDDIGWWAYGCIRAYGLTGDAAYLNQAKTMFDYIEQSNDSTFGGGIWWNRKNFLSQKNVATNAIACITALKIYQATGDADYKAKGEALYHWVSTTLFSGSTNGKVYDNIHYANYGTSGSSITETWEYSYNQGAFFYASYLMDVISGSTAYQGNAISAVNWYISKMSYDGTMNYEGDGDCPAYKMVFTRFLSQYESETGDTSYVPFLQKNATQAFNHARTSDGINGSDWSETPDDSVITSISAAAGADILQLSSPDNVTGVVTGTGVFQAENAHENGVGNDNTATGYMGRGYTAGWNTAGTSVEFPVNETHAGTYLLTFRHSAGAGTAYRHISVNGVTAGQLTFAGTDDWNSWLTSTQISVTLQAGTNIIVAEDTDGDSNYLNLDQMTVVPVYEAENAVLHSLTTESTHAGYTGNGYVAGWNQDGQWIDFQVYAPSAGIYTIDFRYAAGAGNASRYLYVNGGGAVDNLAFPSVGSWDTYGDVSIAVHLNAGVNTISLIYDSSKGSSNYLNLDHLAVIS